MFMTELADLWTAGFHQWESWVDLSGKSRSSEQGQRHSYRAGSPPGWSPHPKIHHEKESRSGLNIKYLCARVRLFHGQIPYLARQRNLDGNRNNFSKEAAVEGHPEHPRVAVGVNQCHLQRQLTFSLGNFLEGDPYFCFSTKSNTD